MESRNANSKSERESLYEIHSRCQILALMRCVQNHNQLVTLTISERADSFVTSILEVSDERDSLVVDAAPSALLNQQFIEADRVSLETTLEKVRIFFSSRCTATCLHEGHPALLLKIPDSLVRLQRREFYRLATSLADPVRCAIPLPEDLGDGVLTLSLVDISCGGVAVMEERRILDETIGRQYENCRIELPGVSTVWAALQVRDCQEVVLPNGKRKRRLGFEFVNLPTAMLAAVQRYIIKLEREQNARTSGLR
jgi:c-di-GMP-binding flagellar brake protein YcgR